VHPHPRKRRSQQGALQSWQADVVRSMVAIGWCHRKQWLQVNNASPRSFLFDRCSSGFKADDVNDDGSSIEISCLPKMEEERKGKLAAPVV
jgi:hypothetical protein